MDSPVRTRRVPVYGIDLLRFLAATCVVIYHLKPRTYHGEMSTVGEVLQGHAIAAVPNGWAWWGFVGVQVFFVISGFVIGYSAQAATARSFFVSRVGRLWPAMFLCASMIAGLDLLFWDSDPAKEAGLWFKSVIFWPAGPWVTGQIWTLPIEIAFYAVVWLLLLAGRIDHLGALAWVLGLGGALFWIAAEQGAVEPGPLPSLLLLRHGCYFALGMVLMQAGSTGWTRPRLALAAICATTAWFEISRVISSDFRAGADVYWPLVPFLVWLAAVALAWISIDRRDGIAARLTTLHPAAVMIVRWMGLATYPLYLIHVQPGALAMRAGLDAGLAPAAAAWLGYTMTVLIALAIAVLLEPALRRRTQALLDRALDAILGLPWRPAT